MDFPILLFWCSWVFAFFLLFVVENSLVGQLQKHGLLGTNNTSGSIDLKQALGHRFPNTTFEMNEKAAILYALAVGEALQNQVDPEALKYTFEGADEFSALPTMGKPNKKKERKKETSKELISL
jgi:hypothetical protein